MSTSTPLNPLAIAVLACLTERPMQPYEIATTLRERGKEDSIQLDYGSLYPVIETMLRQELIRIEDTPREQHSERTVYRVTAAGRRELTTWLRGMLSQPAKEYTQLEAALSLLPVLSPSEVASLLRQRCSRLEAEYAYLEAERRQTTQLGRPRLFLIEGEYRGALRRAELQFTRRLVNEIESGAIDGITWWAGVHALLEQAPADSSLSDVIPPDWGPPASEVR